MPPCGPSPLASYRGLPSRCGHTSGGGPPPLVADETARQGVALGIAPPRCDSLPSAPFAREIRACCRVDSPVRIRDYVQRSIELAATATAESVSIGPARGGRDYGHARHAGELSIAANRSVPAVCLIRIAAQSGRSPVLSSHVGDSGRRWATQRPEVRHDADRRTKESAHRWPGPKPSRSDTSSRPKITAFSKLKAHDSEHEH